MFNSPIFPRSLLSFFSFVLCFQYSILAYGAKADALDIEKFIRKGDYLDVKISPDGTHYAARIRRNDSVYLIVIRLSDLELVGGVNSGADNIVHSAVWANNTRLIYSFAEKYIGRDAATSTGELFAIDLDGKRNKLIAGMRGGDEEFGRRYKSKEDSYASHYVINTLPDDEKHVLIVEHPWSKSGRGWYDRRELKPIVSKLNIYNGRKFEKETMPYAGARPLADDNGNVNFVSWSTDYTNYHSATRNDKSSEWVEVSSMIPEGEGANSVSNINNNGTKVFFNKYLGEQKIRTLYEFDLKQKTFRPVFKNQHPLSYASYDPDGEPFVGVSYPDKQNYDYSLINAESDFVKLHKMLVKAFGGQEIEVLTQTKSGDKVIVRVISSINPGEYYLFNTKTKKADFIFANLSWVDPRNMLSKKPIALKARDGLTLHGYITMPKEVNQKAPMIVLPHGGPHGVRDYHQYEAEVQLLASKGYVVLQPNFRGSGGYGSKFERLGYGQWGKAMVNDVIDATRWAVAQGFADKQRVCIYGASYGGFSSLMSSAMAPDLFQCAVGYVGVYDLELMKKEGDIPLGFIGKNYLNKVLGNDINDLKAQSPINHVEKIKAKVLLIHGDEDARVPSAHAKKMRKALTNVGNKPEWLYLGDVGHGARSEKNLRRVYTTLLSFLDANIGKPSSLDN